MKKIIYILLIFSVFSFTGCFPKESKKEMLIQEAQISQELETFQESEKSQEYITLEYFRDKIRKGETIDFTEYFYSFPPKSYHICKDEYQRCLQDFLGEGQENSAIIEQFSIIQTKTKDLLAKWNKVSDFVDSWIIARDTPFVEYFIDSSLREEGKGLFLQPGKFSPHQLVLGTVNVEGYFILTPKEEYFLCTEMDDITCFPESTWVYNVHFYITKGETPWFLMGDSISVGCYDEINNNILYEYENLNLLTMEVTIDRKQYTKEQVNHFLEKNEKKEIKSYTLIIPPTVNTAQDNWICKNLFFTNPIVLSN